MLCVRGGGERGGKKKEGELAIWCEERSWRRGETKGKRVKSNMGENCSEGKVRAAASWYSRRRRRLKEKRSGVKRCGESKRS